MRKDVLFRGCTRPPMFLGVPYIPFFLVMGACLLLTFYVDMFCLLLIPPLMFGMRQMARRDEMVFRQLGLRWQFRLRVRNLSRHQRLWVFSPNSYRNPRAKRA